jgi:uncharacterized protein (TIGR02466 family)
MNIADSKERDLLNIADSKERDLLFELFPVPMIVTSYKDEYSEEFEWIKKQEYQKNRSNNISKDKYVLDKPELANIRAFFDIKINEYMNNLLQTDDRLSITQSWLNKNDTEEDHHEHSHHNTVLSGVWYPYVDEMMPPISFRSRYESQFLFPARQYGALNSAAFSPPIQSGDLIIFPSNLLHSVSPNKSNNTRYTLGFNTWPKGSFGGVESLDYVDR